MASSSFRTSCANLVIDGMMSNMIQLLQNDKWGWRALGKRIGQKRPENRVTENWLKYFFKIYFLQNFFHARMKGFSPSEIEFPP